MTLAAGRGVERFNVFSFDRERCRRPDQVAAYGSDARKVYAHCYVDDKNVGGMLPWKDIAAWIRRQEEAYRGRLRTPAKFGRVHESRGSLLSQG